MKYRAIIKGSNDPKDTGIILGDDVSATTGEMDQETLIRAMTDAIAGNFIVLKQFKYITMTVIKCEE